MSDALEWNDDDFNPATMEDDVIYIGTRKYVAEDKLNATIIEQQAEIERLREAAKRLLDNYGFCSDGSDHYREVPVEDIESLIAALGATQ